MTTSPPLPARAARLSRVNTALLVANVAGALLYLRMASYAWAIPAERAAGINTVTSEPFIWFLGVAPVLATFAVVDLAWVIAVAVRGRRQRIGLYLAVCVVWSIAVVVDFAHH